VAEENLKIGARGPQQIFVFGAKIGENAFSIDKQFGWVDFTPGSFVAGVGYCRLLTSIAL
jgi:hypothetical protein